MMQKFKSAMLQYKNEEIYLLANWICMFTGALCKTKVSCTKKNRDKLFIGANQLAYKETDNIQIGKQTIRKTDKQTESLTNTQK